MTKKNTSWSSRYDKKRKKSIEVFNQIDNVDKNIIIDDSSNIDKINKKDCYKELTTNEDYAIYISEVVDNNFDSKKNVVMDTKKKNKKDKNIFVTNQNNDI